MANNTKDELQTIPGVGPSIAEDLRELGITRVADLKAKDPERLYARSNALRGVTQDRCLLYVFRCAVYFSKTKRPDPEKLKWWNWKELPGSSRRSPQPLPSAPSSSAYDGRRNEGRIRSSTASPAKKQQSRIRTH